MGFFSEAKDKYFRPNGDIDNVLRRNGINHSAGAFENNPTSQRSAATAAMQKQSLGTDVLGKEQFVDERSSHHLYDRMYDDNGKARGYGGNQATTEMRMLKADVTKTHGKFTLSNGAQTGIGFGWQGNRMASGGAQLMSGAIDTVKVGGEGTLNALGLMTRQQQVQFKTGNIMAKSMAVAPAALSLYNNVSTILDGGDIGDAMAMNMTAVGGAMGFHYGKSMFGAASSGMAAVGAKLARTPKGAARTGGAAVASVNAKTGVTSITGGKLRLGAQAFGGILGGGLGTLAAATIGYGVQDLTSSESSIAKAARSYSQLSSSASIEQNNSTLTMRQKALQQLSQSSLNDRGSLLGNEAAILKNLQ